MPAGRPAGRTTARPPFLYYTSDRRTDGMEASFGWKSAPQRPSLRLLTRASERASEEAHASVAAALEKDYTQGHEIGGTAGMKSGVWAMLPPPPPDDCELE